MANSTTEVIDMQESIRDLIQHTPLASTLQAAARKHHFMSLQEDGLIKALRGQTTIEEVLRLVPNP